ncbi:MAG: hypothetical protein HUJ88_12135 [Fusobacterium necrophorum]|nr:hypothetical protein [Fusobacterium necrophorum]
MEMKEKIRFYIRYLGRDSFTGFYELRFLPDGESVGYNHHDWEDIWYLENMKNALNEIISQKQ